MKWLLVFTLYIRMVTICITYNVKELYIVDKLYTSMIPQ